MFSVYTIFIKKILGDLEMINKCAGLKSWQRWRGQSLRIGGKLPI